MEFQLRLARFFVAVQTLVVARGLSSGDEWTPELVGFSRCGTRAFSSCGAQAQECKGTVAPLHVGS